MLKSGNTILTVLRLRFSFVNLLRLYHFFFCLFWGGLVYAQELKVGFGVEAGASWEIERLPYNAAPTPLTGVDGGGGYALSLEIRYSLDALSLAFRPALLAQQTTAFRLPDDDSGMSFRQKLYPAALLLPLRASLAFGQQRFQPVLGVGGGFLVAVKEENNNLAVPKPVPVLPYLEVSVGVCFRAGGLHLRPELTVRNGTGELFPVGHDLTNLPYGGQRWGYAGFGLTVSK